MYFIATQSKQVRRKKNEEKHRTYSRFSWPQRRKQMNDFFPHLEQRQYNTIVTVSKQANMK